MDKLSQELIDHITSYFDAAFDEDDLKQLLTVSKAFQNSVERITLAQYQLTKDNADNFLRQYAGERIHYLRYVQFLPTFPMASGDRNPDDGCREKSSELLEKDKLFTRQIGVLFKTLKCIEDRVGAERIRGRLRLIIFTPRRAAMDRPCRHLVCVCWRVHLLHPETLPRLSSIHTLEFKDGNFTPLNRVYTFPNAIDSHTTAKLDLRIVIDLASKIMSLEQLECGFDAYFDGMRSIDESIRHFTQDWAGPHRDTRHDFARSLDSITLPFLKRMNLGYRPKYHATHNQTETLPNLILPRQYDPFSTSLRVLSYQLETMVLQVTADQTLFWPTNDTTPHWPNMRYLDVYFEAHSPSGEWYFQGPQGEGSNASPGYEITQAHYEPMEANATDRYHDEVDNLFYEARETNTQFRVVPIDKTLRPFLIAFAKAANSMPSLRKALLWTGLEFCPDDVYDYYENLSTEISDAVKARIYDLGWGIAYAKPGEDIEMKGIGHKNCASRQFWWMTQDWRPDATLHSLFDKIGQFQHGNEVMHHWGSDEGQKWYRRSLFNGLIRCAEDPRPKLLPTHMLHK